MKQQHNQELSIQLIDVKKRYRLGQIGGGTLQGDLQTWWAKLRGKEDPNSIIGQKQRLTGQSFMALNGISLKVYRGEALGIIGANGAGKSTMLKLLSRITAPTEGTIDLYGRVASMLEVGTGFNGEMTGRENIYMNGAILGMTKAEIDKKMEDIIEFSEVREFIDTPVKRYSSGMYVKLAFSVAAHLDSEILIMDEVLAVGDVAFQKKCLERMQWAASKEGRTVLYVSHNMNTIRQLCDRCIVMDQGEIVFDGDVEEAINVYMGETPSLPCNVDLTEAERTMEQLHQGIKIKAIELLDHDKWSVKAGEKIKFVLKVVCELPVSNISFRCRIYRADGTSVTVLKAPNILSTDKAGEFSVTLEADISEMVPGYYCLTPVLYRTNEYGGWEFFDHVDNVIMLSIENIPGFNENMPWDAYWWGSVKFPDLTVLN